MRFPGDALGCISLFILGARPEISGEKETRSDPAVLHRESGVVQLPAAEFSSRIGRLELCDTAWLRTGARSAWIENERPAEPAVPTNDSRKESGQLALYITHGKVKDVAVLWLVGRIVLGKETNALREKAKSLFDEGYKKLVLNMDGVTLIDSAGLGALVALYYSANSCGASLRLCHLGSKFKDVLYITRLYTIFEISDTQADALRSFSE